MTVDQVERTAKQDEFVAGFDEAAFNELDSKAEPEAVRALREKAFSAYRAIPVPTGKMEEWRRTHPEKFPLGKMERLPTVRVVEDFPRSDWDEHFDVVVFADDKSVGVRDVSGAMKDGKVIVSTVQEAAQKHPELLAQYTQGEARAEATGKFEALADAFWNVGVFVHVPARVELEKGILFRYEQKKAGSIGLPRLLVTAGEQSRATIVERFNSPDDVALMSIMAKEFYVDEAARIRCITLREWGDRTYHIASDWAKTGRDAQIDWITLNFGGRVCKMRFGSDGAGPGASAELDGLYFINREQHFDQKTLQVHSSPHTYSRLLYKGVVKDEANSVYQGLIIAKPGAMKVDAYQTNNNIVLNSGARADSLPGLRIDCDDLKCSHGSTVGNLDEEEVFYLRSRGLDEKTARTLLIKGFFEEVAQRIPYDFVRDAVHKHIDAKIG